MRKSYPFLFLYLAVSFLFVDVVHAQNPSQNIWYFGSGGLGVRFNRNTNAASLVTNTSAVGNQGGSAVAIDRATGNLLFYTDGLNVYDAIHEVMPGGTLTANQNGNQPVAIVPVPGQPDQYLIFSNSAAFGAPGNVTVSTVDMTQPGNAVFPAPPLGEITPGAVQLTGRSEGMTIVPHENGTDFWLITHQASSQAFTATLIDASLTFPSTDYTLGTVSASLQVSNFSYHEGSGKLAVAPATANQNVLVLNFDNTTGEITLDQAVPNSASPVAQGIYDTEWSPSGRYLYISRNNDVLQFDTNDNTIPLQTVLPAGHAVGQSYGLQIGPDSLMYFLYQSGGNIFMGRFDDPDSAYQEVDFTSQVFPGNNFGGRQFPAFFPNYTPEFVVDFIAPDPTCANSPIIFSPSELTPGADSVVWDFGDGQSSTQLSPIHTYEAEGTYNVTLTAYLNGESQAQATGVVNPTAFDVQIDLVQDTTACSCSLPFPRNPPSAHGPDNEDGLVNPPDPEYCNPFTVTATVNGGTSPTYQWFGPGGLLAGQTSLSLSPDSAGYYYLKVTDANGCSAYAGVNIKEYAVEDTRANIWHFGNNAGIDFNPVFDEENPRPATPITGPVNSPHGSATISDRNGQVIISTDGVNVYDREGNILDGTLAGDNNSTQSSLIVPFPGDETLYYIFTTQDVPSGGRQLSYAIFDLKVLPHGALIDTDPTTTIVDPVVVLHNNTTERLSSNGSWLVTHDYGTNCFRAFQITPDGISAPVVSCEGSDHSYSNATTGEGYMKFFGDNSVAVALQKADGSNVVEIFDFVDSTGTVDNFREIPIPSPGGQVYGLEYSGNKLFITVTGNPSYVYEVVIDEDGNPVLPPVLIATENAALGAIQVGPDGTLYVAKNGADHLATIQPNGDPDTPSTFTSNGFPQGVSVPGGWQSTLGLPNFIQIISDPAQEPGMSVDGSCVDAAVQFSATPSDQSIDVFDWRITQNGNQIHATTEQSFEWTFEDPGVYDVTLVISNGCGYEQRFESTITIYDNPAAPFFLPDDEPAVIGCPDPVLPLDAYDDPATGPNDPAPAGWAFLWTTGETTETINASQPGQYGVTITDNNGCVSDGVIDVVQPAPTINLGNDQAVCAEPNGSITLNTFINYPGHSWTVDGAPVGTNSGQLPIDISTPSPAREYIVVFTDPINNCISSDTVNITVNETPDIDLISSDITCGASNGQIQLTINSPVGANFNYTVNQGIISSGSGLSVGGPTPITNADLATGAYLVEVSDELTGCSVTRTATISSDNHSVTASVPDLCNPTIDAVLSPSILPGYTYRVLNSNNEEVLSGGTSFPSASVPRNDTYVLEVTPVDGCIVFSQPVDVYPSEFIVSFNTSDLCNQNLSVVTTPAGASSYNWTSAPAGAVNGSNSNATVSLFPGNWDITVVVDDGPGATCPSTGTITVEVPDGLVTPVIDVGDPCTDPVILTATAPGANLSYRWLRGTSAGAAPSQVILGGRTLLVSSAFDGFLYSVQTFNPSTGCLSNESANATVTVVGPLDVDLVSTPACEGSPFTITGEADQTITTYTWSYAPINNNTFTVIPEATGTTLSDTRAGRYRLEVISTQGCEASDQIQILLAPATPSNLPPRAIICNDPDNNDPDTRQVELNPGPGFTAYNWSTGDDTQTIIVDEPGIFSVELTNAFGCISSDETEVVVDCTPRITGPNAFRPSGTTNPEFFLYTFFIDDANFQIFIFNRWGEMVFESKDRAFRWNGNYNNSGKILPPGTYTYVVKYKSSYRPEKGIQEQRGGVVLLR